MWISQPVSVCDGSDSDCWLMECGYITCVGQCVHGGCNGHLYNPPSVAQHKHHESQHQTLRSLWGAQTRRNQKKTVTWQIVDLVVEHGLCDIHRLKIDVTLWSFKLSTFSTIPGAPTDLGGVKVTTTYTKQPGDISDSSSVSGTDSPLPESSQDPPKELLCLKVGGVCVCVCVCLCVCGWVGGGGGGGGVGFGCAPTHWSRRGLAYSTSAGIS